MIWKNTEEGIVLPKPILFVISAGLLMASYMTIEFMLKTHGLMDKIVTGVTGLVLIFMAIPNIELLLMGSRYVDSIQKDEACFIVTNFFNKKVIFNRSEIESIKLWDNSKINKITSIFIRKLQGIDLVLKCGDKFRITSDMENFESLKEHLLGGRIV